MKQQHHRFIITAALSVKNIQAICFNCLKSHNLLTFKFRFSRFIIPIKYVKIHRVHLEEMKTYPPRVQLTLLPVQLTLLIKKLTLLGGKPTSNN